MPDFAIERALRGGGVRRRRGRARAARRPGRRRRGDHRPPPVSRRIAPACSTIRRRCRARCARAAMRALRGMRPQRRRQHRGRRGERRRDRPHQHPARQPAGDAAGGGGARATAAPRIPDLALVDGNVAPTLPCPVKTVVKGDALSFSIAAASVVAKVTRDRIMRGFGAALSRLWLGHQCRLFAPPSISTGIRRLGVTPHHRRSFEPVRLALSGPADLFALLEAGALARPRRCGGTH